MPYTYVYPTRINWENEPSINTPLNATNLNKIDYAVYEHDRTLGTLNVPTYTSTISKAIGETSVTFTNASIATTSILELLTQNASGTPMSYTDVSVTTGSATYTFDALTEATDFKVRITNL